MNSFTSEIAALANSMFDRGVRCDIERLKADAKRFNTKIAEITDALPADAYLPALEGLKRARLFRELAEAAEMVIRVGYDSPKVRNLMALALIEERQVSAAITLLEQIAADPAATQADRLETYGLLGRAHKQIYIDERRRPRRDWATGALRRSIEAYAKGYVEVADLLKTDWHVINVVGLIRRAEQDGIDVGGSASAPLVNELIRALTPVLETSPADDDRSVWRLAVLGTAYLARSDWQNAANWFGRYAQHPRLDAFKLIGTIRQLEEVWGLEPGPDEAGRIVAALKARVLTMGGGHSTFSTTSLKALGDVVSQGLPLPEAILGKEGPFQIGWLKDGLRSAQSVARIRWGRRGNVGTGFLVRGRDLCSGSARIDPGAVYLMTNNHVISSLPGAHAIRPEEAEVSFDEDVTRRTHDCGEIIWQSPLEELDATLVKLDPSVDSFFALPIAADDVLPECYREGEAQHRAYIIGHPAGEELSISLHDSDVIDIGFKRPDKAHHCYLHYRTPTKPGSSGSPVFRQSEWEVIGLHHAGPPDIGGNPKLGGKSGFNPPVNEGIALRSIKRQMAADLGCRAA